MMLLIMNQSNLINKTEESIFSNRFYNY